MEQSDARSCRYSRSYVGLKPHSKDYITLKMWTVICKNLDYLKFSLKFQNIFNIFVFFAYVKNYYYQVAFKSIKYKYTKYRLILINKNKQYYYWNDLNIPRRPVAEGSTLIKTIL